MQFLQVIGGWINRHFSNEEAIYLVVLLIAGFLTLFVLGQVLAPVLTGLVLAFLLQGLVKRLMRWRLPEKAAVYLTFLLFIGGMLALVAIVVPLVWQQLRAMVTALPQVIDQLRTVAAELAGRFPDVVTEAQIDQWVTSATNHVGALSGTVLETLVANVPSVVGLLIYLVLVPISVFFFLTDRANLLAWLGSLLPQRRPMLNQVGREMNRQLANYVRGKFIEILIVGAVTYLSFTLMGVNYAALLGVIVGLSVLIPFVGAAVATLPVALVAMIQFGWTWDAAWVLIVYGVIQGLDGNVLVPLLFSEANDLHPITIILAILVFGGLWGFWGVFFAIPLATLVKAIYNAWPRQDPALGIDVAGSPSGSADTAPEARL